MSAGQSVHPFDDIRKLLDMMPDADEAAVEEVRARNNQLTKPQGSLGRLEHLVEWLAAWQGKAKPTISRPLVCVFAASHGVTKHPVSAYPSEVNQQMLDNFAAGGAAINQICATYELGFKVFDLALELPTGDISSEAAMDEKSCVATMAFGMEAIAGGIDLLAVGEMGIGNTTIAAAIYAALYGGGGQAWVGRGTGISDENLQHKIRIVDAALAYHKDHLDNPLEILCRLGGRDIAAMAGAILAARLQRIPVILDGYVATSAAAILHALNPKSLDHCISGHLSAEPAHQKALECINKIPLLALGMRLGEGSGAAMAIGIVKAAFACHQNMATFEQAKVSEKIMYVQ